MADFFTELKRRRVPRVVIVYAVVAWAAIQGAGTLVQLLELPAWTGKLVFVIALVGFPIAVALAWAFDITPAGIERTASTTAVSLPSRRSVWFVVGIMVALSVAWFAFRRETNKSALDTNVVAVLPFRVSGAQPALGGMREGMVDLLAAKLTGEGGPRALDPRAVISRVKQAGNSDDLEPTAGLDIARSLGAGWLIRGELVGLPREITLNAVLIETRSGDERARTSVHGSPDSVSVLVDRLAAQLLAKGARIPQDQLNALQYVPLEAVQAYLAGQSAYRHGSCEGAVNLFLRALQIDSTFAVVLPALVSALEWTDHMNDARAHFFRLRDRLSDRDRALVEMYTGPDFRADSYPGDLENATQRALQLAPDHPESHYMAGDIRFHYPFPANPTKDLQVAERYFLQALQLDSTFAPALGHMVEIAALQHDTAAVRRYTRRYLAADSAGDLTDYVRWVAATALADQAALRSLRSRFATMTSGNTRRILGYAEMNGVGLDDADLLVRQLLDSSPGVSGEAVEYVFDRGDEALVQQATKQHPEYRMPLALLGGGDTTGVTTAIEPLRAKARQPLPAAATPQQKGEKAGTTYDVAMWDLSHGDTRGIDVAIQNVRPVLPGLAAVLDAFAATVRRSADARQKLAVLDSAIYAGRMEDPHAQIIAARLHEQLGDTKGALALYRATPRHWATQRVLATQLKEEGRLAAATGNRAEAIDAYTHYLALRSNPSRRYIPERDWVRNELARLTRDR